MIRPLPLLALLIGLLASSNCTVPAGPPVKAGAVPAPAAARPGALQITPEIRAKVAKKIWQNECGGTVQGLVSWNAGEGFASVGIGHFIWFPKGKTFPYEESFPGLQRFLADRGVQLPAWLAPGQPCPWNSKAAFDAEKNGARATELRKILAGTVDLQGEFIVRRLEAALPRLLAAAPAEQRALIDGRFRAVATTPHGMYALIDYVNFKGEGVNPKERYKGQGWGLLQVLQEMSGTPGGAAAATEFSGAARRTLAQRVANAPKDETRWTAGWNNRVATYSRPLP